MKQNVRLAIFASGDGSNAENIIRYFRSNDSNCEVALVVSSRQSAKVVQRAGSLDVPVSVLSRDELNNPEIALPLLESYGVNAIALAGFLLSVPPFLIHRYDRRIINIHPALLPKFGGKGMYGKHVHEAVVAAGEHETGITIHYVTENYDEGEIIFQAKVKIGDHPTPEKVADMVHSLEYRHYPQVIDKIFAPIENSH